MEKSVLNRKNEKTAIYIISGTKNATIFYKIIFPALINEGSY